jgi:hypothetical protein
MLDIKSVTISCEAAKSMGVVRRRASRKKTQGGGDVVGMESPLAARSAPITQIIKVDTAQAQPQVPQPLQPSQPPQQVHQVSQPSQVQQPSQPPQPEQVSQASQQVSQQGGKIRVELKKKPLTKKVQLHPKKADVPKVAKKPQTKKNRKVLLGMSSLHRRVTRAKKVHTKMKDMPLDKLKALLITKKLIKPASKAPESVLRQIAADAHIVENNAL